LNSICVIILHFNFINKMGACNTNTKKSSLHLQNVNNVEKISSIRHIIPENDMYK